MTKKLAADFRAAAERAGVPPVMYITAEEPGTMARYSGDEYGMTITGAGVVMHMVVGLSALHKATESGET